MGLIRTNMELPRIRMGLPKTGVGLSITNMELPQRVCGVCQVRVQRVRERGGGRLAPAVRDAAQRVPRAGQPVAAGALVGGPSAGVLPALVGAARARPRGAGVPRRVSRKPPLQSPPCLLYFLLGLLRASESIPKEFQCETRHFSGPPQAVPAVRSGSVAASQVLRGVSSHPEPRPGQPALRRWRYHGLGSTPTSDSL